jgi:hypothetical protein
MASSGLQITGQNGNRQTLTHSFWVKRSKITSESILFYSRINSNNHFLIRFTGDDKLELLNRESGINNFILTTNRLFRDVSAWYHIVVAVDTTQSTTNDRIKFYVNSVQETSFATQTIGSQNANMSSNYNTATLYLGQEYTSGSNYFDGSMAHVHLIDGTAYDASAFGETDATTGIWKPKTAPSVTYGTNGFFLKFENSGAFGTDSSGNANNLTVNGTMTQNIDTPSNVFATWNPLEYANNNFSYANGNTYSSISYAGYNYVTSTLGASSGKYYCEMKANTTDGSSKWMFGIATHPSLNANDDFLGKDSDAWGYKGVDGELYNNSINISWGGTYGAGDIIGVAMDLDNNRLFFSINGVWQNSADPTTSTGAISITAPSSTSTGFYHFAWGDLDATGAHTMYANFGNGYFGTTAVSSAQNPDDGIGIFEYDVPAGYYALNTKAINAQEYD